MRFNDDQQSFTKCKDAINGISKSPVKYNCAELDEHKMICIFCRYLCLMDLSDFEIVFIEQNGNCDCRMKAEGLWAERAEIGEEYRGKAGK